MRNTTPANPDEYAPIVTPDIATFQKIDNIVNKVYLSKLDKCRVSPCPEELKKRNIEDSVCLFRLDRIVYDKNENNQQKLSSVFSSAASSGTNIAMIIQADEYGNVNMYMGACDESSYEDGAVPKAEILYHNFVGNFPGCRKSETGILNIDETKRLINNCFSSDSQAIVSVSGIASSRGQKKDDKNDSFYQGIEKVIEAMDGKKYSVVILARGIDADEIEEMKAEMEMLYTQLIPYAKSTLSINESNADSIMKTQSESVSDSLSKTESKSLTIGESKSQSESNGGYKGTGDSVGLHGGVGGELLHIGGSYSHSWNRGESWNTAKTHGTNKSESNSESETNGHTTTVTTSDGTTVSFTEGESVQMSFENKTILEILNAIEYKLKRLKTGAGMGMFATAAYFISDSVFNAKIAACAYKASISGDNTYLENSSINTWHYSGGEEGKRFLAIRDYLHQLCHPVFIIDDERSVVQKNEKATPATIVTAPELAIHMSLPKSSVKGIPVKESISFGRNIISLNSVHKTREGIQLGSIYHLNHKEKSLARLDLESLTMHVFVTGTTGSGKSNTIYGMLDSIIKARRDTHFLVIEPAKGEYKSAFSDRNDVTVFGTNPYITPLLRINPFRFRKGVHVLEHLDRLISIFNVCWPMEAAMPAVLKEALERAYQLAGWDLRRSVNRYTDHLFPTFSDVMKQVQFIMEESKYSADNKGDYEGALCTRLSELTTGLNGMVFAADDISDEVLFNSNVIVDLSRIGAAETKSLIMGLLIIRLQEYRQCTYKQSNAKLNHVTVLEEAHHLMKRTSTEQSMNSANLVGKSVEMLSNAFAEMRTSGESFIIADQSPEQMDMSVIRNTNTKIVMRLPSFEDRKLVGKSMGLNDNQIIELSKLPTGVAAVYQNDWMEAVLVQMPYFEGTDNQYSYEPKLDASYFSDQMADSLLDAIMGANIDLWVDYLKGEKIEQIAKIGLPTNVKIRLMDYVLNEDEDKLDRIACVAYEYFNTADAFESARSDISIEDWKNDVLRRLEPHIEEYSEGDKEVLLLTLAYEQTIRDNHFLPIWIKLNEISKRK